MGKIIACVNEKGGVAKTTTVKNLSVGLAKHGKRVLAIDLDPSANLTDSLGISIDENTLTILDCMEKAMYFEEVSSDYAVIHHEEGIDVIPSTKEIPKKNDLHKFETSIMSADHREMVLQNALSVYVDEYDYIFIDCPAGLGIYVSNALYCADSIIIPVQPQFLGYGAMQNLLRKVAAIWRYNGTFKGNHKPEIMGILFTQVKQNTNNDKDVMEAVNEITNVNKIKIFNTVIPNSVRFPESDGQQESIFKFAPKSTAAAIYDQLVNEFLYMEEGE